MKSSTFISESLWCFDCLLDKVRRSVPLSVISVLSRKQPDDISLPSSHSYIPFSVHIHIPPRLSILFIVLFCPFCFSASLSPCLASFSALCVPNQLCSLHNWKPQIVWDEWTKITEKSQINKESWAAV